LFSDCSVTVDTQKY